METVCYIWRVKNFYKEKFFLDISSQSETDFRIVFTVIMWIYQIVPLKVSIQAKSPMKTFINGNILYIFIISCYKKTKLSVIIT